MLNFNRTTVKHPNAKLCSLIYDNTITKRQNPTFFKIIHFQYVESTKWVKSLKILDIS